MRRFQILCVTMHQKDFAKIEEMNIRSDVIFTNQADRTADEQIEFSGHTARMITTDTRGVGINRNLGLMYADAEICLLADDDMIYADDMEERVLKEFDLHPDADIIIFGVESNDEERKEVKYDKTRKCRGFYRMPWGAVRIAFRLNSIRKANLWFTSLFGGGCLFLSGEDSKWLHEAKKKGLVFYVSKEVIGTVSFDTSTWYKGLNESFFYSKGAYCQAVHLRCFLVWTLYYAWRFKQKCSMTFAEKVKWMWKGRKGYIEMLSYEAYVEKHNGL